MARTFYAEGRQIAMGLRAVFVLLSIGLFYFFPGIHWGVVVGCFFAGIILAEIIGSSWVKKRRAKRNESSTKAKSTVQHREKTSLGKKSPSISTSSKKLTDEQLMKANVNTLSGMDFERLMAIYYTDEGYAVRIVGGSGDHEVDLILTDKKGYKIAVQCKRWKKDVGNDIVLRLKAGKQVHGCYDAWIVTTSHFTASARSAAEKLNIRLINGLILEDKLRSWKKRKGINI